MSVNCVFIIFLYFFANVSANNVTQDGKPRIIGGSVCKTQDHRFMVSITTPRGFAFCGGTLLNSRWVLTAAHCRGEDMFVYAGRNYQSEFKKFFSVKIEKAYPHPYYNKLYSDNDIALHRLAKPVPQDARFVKYVKLPDKPFPEDISKQCKEALAMGWGVTDTFSKEVAKALQCVTLPVISPDRCGSMYSSLHYYISNNMICTYSAYNKDACQGDSGGPLMCGDTQIGIVSWGQGCADYRYPGVYTRVDKYLSFINITMIKHGMSGTTASSIADSLVFFLVLLSAYLVLEI